MQRETKRKVTISKMQNVFTGLKFKYPNGIYALELKNNLKSLQICCSPNYMSSYIKAGLLQIINKGPKTKYFINSDLNKIIYWYDENHKFKVKSPSKNKKEIIATNEKRNKIIDCIEYLIENGYFVQKLTEDVKIIITKK